MCIVFRSMEHGKSDHHDKMPIKLISEYNHDSIVLNKVLFSRMSSACQLVYTTSNNSIGSTFFLISNNHTDPNKTI